MRKGDADVNHTVGSNVHVRRFVRAVLGSVSTLSLSAVAPVFAQNAVTAANTTTAAGQSTGDLQEVVVTGIRASLQKSLDIKKDALGVVDAISAEDIGKFPDSNLAAAIQRVPGVSVSRGASARRPVS